jgi:hypothetical protein
MFIGASDMNCPVSNAESILAQLDTGKGQSLTVIDKVDPEDPDSGDMGHNEWLYPLSETNLRLMLDALSPSVEK